MKINIAKISAAFLIAVLLLCTICACTETPSAQPDSSNVVPPVQSDNGEVVSTQENEIFPEPRSTDLKTAVKGEQMPHDFSDVHVYDDGNGIESYYVWNESEMTDVMLFSIEYDTESDDFDTTALLAQWETVPSGDALRLDLLIPEVLPTLALSCTVAGEKKTVLLCYNGRDGGISFVPCDYIDSSDIVQKSDSSEEEEQTDGVMFAIYLLDDNAETVVCREMTIESRSAWHAWAALKQLNPAIPAKAYLNSFTIEGNEGTLDLTKDFLSANVGASTEALLVQAIANTYIENYDIERLYITIDGGVYESGHLLLDEPLTYKA